VKIAVNVIPMSGSMPSIFIIEMKKLKEDDPKQKEWIDSINAALERSSAIMPSGWRCLEEARVNKFPCKIHGAVDIYYNG
jgi:hypothetical protein